MNFWTLTQPVLLVFMLGLAGCGSDSPSGTTSPPVNTDPDYDLGVPAVPDACAAVEGPAPAAIGDSLVTEGYTDRLSYGSGEPVRMFLNGTSVTRARVGIYTLNHVRVDEVEVSVRPQTRAGGEAFRTGYGFCHAPEAYRPPAALPSGVYLIADRIPFVYRGGGAGAGDIAVVFPTNTIQAYNAKGGGSLYNGKPFHAEVSFLRPMAIDRLSSGEGFLRWALEQPEELRRRFRYLSDQDLDDATRLEGASVLVIIGHSEYWTRRARLNFDRFVASGRNALILSGNTMWWQVRYGQGGTSLICHRSNMADGLGTPDPVANPLLQTVRWFESWLAYPILDSIGADFRYARYQRQPPLAPYKPFGGFKIVHGESPLLAGTGLRKGDILPHVSSEWDGLPLLGFGDQDDNPVINRDRFNPYRLEIVGFEHTRSDYESTSPTAEVYAPAGTAATWVVWQKTPQSGIIINVAANFWTTQASLQAGSGDLLRRITFNMVDTLANGRSPFSGP